MIRRHYRQALDLDGLQDDRVVGCGVGLIDLGLLRIGSPASTRANGTFGLCTIERRHVGVTDGKAFRLPRKGGKDSGGSDFSGDFRTWNATVLAAVNLARSTESVLSQREAQCAVTSAIKHGRRIVGEHAGCGPPVGH